MSNVGLYLYRDQRCVVFPVFFVICGEEHHSFFLSCRLNSKEYHKKPIS